MAQVLFWIISVTLVLISGLIVLAPLLRARPDARDAGHSDVAVYRDQLAELKADVERGTLSAEEAETSRIEISRRLLAADDRAKSAPRPARSGSARAVFAAGLIALVALSFGTYALIGGAGAPDQPLSARFAPITQEEAEARFAAQGGGAPKDLEPSEQELLDRLRAVLKDRPDDAQGFRLLASTLDSMGDYAGAWRAQDELLRILGPQAQIGDLADKAEMMIFAGGGFVSEEADEVLAMILSADPADRRARYYSAVSLAQSGKAELAISLWAGMLQEGPPDAPWKEPVRAQMRALAAEAGINLPSSALAGPSAEDVEAASEMSEEDRSAMIRGMVEGLAERLASEGGTGAEWARLIRALGVLGETDRASAIYGEAQTTFASDPAAMAEIDAAAQSAGLK